MVGIIVKNYDHHNRAFPGWNSPKGRYISSKQQYEKAVRESGLIPYEKAEEIRKDKEEKAKKSYKSHSPETIAFIEGVRQKSDRKTGRVKLSDSQIDHMISKGAIKDRDVFADRLPKVYRDKGGFSG